MSQYRNIRKLWSKKRAFLLRLTTYDLITFLPMCDCSGSYNRYFGRLDTGKMKIRGVMARKGDTPEYLRRMQQELFDVMTKARSLNELFAKIFGSYGIF